MFEIRLTLSQLLRATKGTLCGPVSTSSESTLRTTCIQSIFTDSREIVKQGLFIAITGENFDGHNFLPDAINHGATLLCIEKNKSSVLPPNSNALLVDSTVKAFQDIARYHRMRLHDLKVIMLTGSNGKTSTKEALRAIFEHVYGKESVLATEGNTNNQLGVPQNILRLNKKHKIAILEAGTNHHGEIEPLSACARPDVGIIVSIGRSHLEYLGTTEKVAEEKSTLFNHMRKEIATAIFPAKCSGKNIIKNAARHCKQYTFGSCNTPKPDYHVEYLGGDLLGASFRITINETGETADVHWPIPGKHQAENATAAIAAARVFGFSLSDCADGLAKTHLPGFRAKATKHNGSQWINDAYNANPDSMEASLQWLSEFVNPRKLILILGDMGELGDTSHAGHKSVCKTARKLFPESRLVLIGPNMRHAAESLKIDAEFYNDAASAKELGKSIRKGSTVFLKASRYMKLESIEPGDVVETSSHKKDKR